jgi:Zn-dependent M28 family amino/carboxypeptidase
MELAAYFSKPENQKGLKKNLLFAIWSGEELGILGSTAYLKNQKHLNQT